MQRSYLYGLLFMTIFGALDGFKGFVIPQLQAHLDFSYGDAAFIMSSANIGFLAASFLSGFLVDHWGIRRVWLIGIGFFGVGLISFGLSQGLLMMVVFFVASGFGAGGIEIGINSLIPLLYPNQQSKYFNLLHGFYGIGGVIGPLVAGWIFGLGVLWGPFYVIFGVCLLILLGLLSRASLPREGTGEKMDWRALKGLLQHRTFILFTLLMIFYVASEVGLGAWLPTYLIHIKGYSTEKSGLFLSIFFIAFTIGRLWGGVVVEKIGDTRTLVSFSMLGFIFVTLGQRELAGAAWLFPLSGFFYSVIFPTMASIVSRTFPQRTGTALGFLFAAAGLGGMLSTWLIGALIDRWGLIQSFSLIGWMLLVVTIGVTGWTLLEGKIVQRANQN